MITPDNARTPEITPLSLPEAPKEEEAKTQLEIAPAPSKAGQVAKATAIIVLSVVFTGGLALIAQRVRDAIYSKTITLQGKAYYVKDLREEVNRHILATNVTFKNEPPKSTEIRATTHMSQVKVLALREMLTPEVKQLAKTPSEFESIMREKLEEYRSIKPNTPEYTKFMHFLRTNSKYSKYTSAESSQKRAEKQSGEIEQKAFKEVKERFATRNAITKLVADYKHSGAVIGNKCEAFIKNSLIQKRIHELYNAIDSGDKSKLAACKQRLNVAIAAQGRKEGFTPLGLVDNLIQSYKNPIEPKDAQAFEKEKQAAMSKEFGRLTGLDATPLHDSQMLFDYCLDNRMNNLFQSFSADKDVAQFLKVAVGEEDLKREEAEGKESIQRFIGFWNKHKTEVVITSSLPATSGPQELMAQRVELEKKVEQLNRQLDSDKYNFDPKALDEDPLRYSEDFRQGIDSEHQTFDTAAYAAWSKEGHRILDALKGKLAAGQAKRDQLTEKMEICNQYNELKGQLHDLESDLEKIPPEDRASAVAFENAIGALKSTLSDIETIADKVGINLKDDWNAVKQDLEKQIKEVNESNGLIKREGRLIEVRIHALKAGPDGMKMLYDPRWLNDYQQKIHAYRQNLHNVIQVESPAFRKQMISDFIKQAEAHKKDLIVFQNAGNFTPEVKSVIEQLSAEISALKRAEVTGYGELEMLFLPNLRFAQQWFSNSENRGKRFWVHAPTGRYASEPKAITSDVHMQAAGVTPAPSEVVASDWQQVTNNEYEQFLISLLADGHGQYDMNLNRVLILAVNKWIGTKTDKSEVLSDSSKSLMQRLLARDLCQAYHQVQQYGGQIWRRDISGISTYHAGFQKPDNEAWQPMSRWDILAKIPDLMSLAGPEDISRNDFTATEVMSLVNAEMLPYQIVINEDGRPDLEKLDVRGMTPTERLSREKEQIGVLQKAKDHLPAVDDKITPEELKKNLLIAVCCYARLAKEGLLEGEGELSDKIRSYAKALPPSTFAIKAPEPGAQVICMDANNAVRVKPRADLVRSDKLGLPVTQFNAFVIAQGGVDKLLQNREKAAACYEYLTNKLQSRDTDAKENRSFLLEMRNEIAEGFQHLETSKQQVAELDKFKPNIQNAKQSQINKMRADLELRFKDNIHPGAARIAYREVEAMLSERSLNLYKAIIETSLVEEGQANLGTLLDLSLELRSTLEKAIQKTPIEIPEEISDLLLPGDIEKLEALAYVSHERRPIVLHLLLSSPYIDKLLVMRDREAIESFCSKIGDPETRQAMLDWFETILPGTLPGEMKIPLAEIEKWLQGSHVSFPNEWLEYSSKEVNQISNLRQAAPEVRNELLNIVHANSGRFAVFIEQREQHEIERVCQRYEVENPALGHALREWFRTMSKVLS